MKNFKNFQIIEVRFYGATNHRGSRIGIVDTRFKQRDTLPYDYAIGNVLDQATQYLEDEGFNIVGISDGIIITDTFKPIKEEV